MSKNQKLEDNAPQTDVEEQTSTTEVDGEVTQNPDYVEPAKAVAAVPFAMSKSFEEILTEFFTRYSRKKLKFVPRIVAKFKGNEEAVLMHLCKKYKVNPSTLVGVTLPDIDYMAMAAAAREKREAMGETKGKSRKSAAASSASDTAEAGVKKKKSPMMLIIILVIVLGGAGAAGFFFKDQLMGMIGGGDHSEEHPTEAAAGHDDASAKASTDAEAKAAAEAEAEALAIENAEEAAAVLEAEEAHQAEGEHTEEH